MKENYQETNNFNNAIQEIIENTDRVTEICYSAEFVLENVNPFGQFESGTD